jgi:hypothetical protein
MSDTNSAADATQREDASCRAAVRARARARASVLLRGEDEEARLAGRDDQAHLRSQRAVSLLALPQSLRCAAPGPESPARSSRRQ